MSNKRVPAFTIMEVTIAMLLSAIVIGITYTVFTIVTRSYRDYQLKHEKMAVVLRLDELLRKDFDRADIIMKDTDGIAMKNKMQLTKYRFYGDYVLRVGTTVDTFKVKTDSVVSSFENQMITTDASGEQSRVDQLDVLIILEKEKIPYYYYKIYSSVNLINRKSNAVN